MKWENYNSMSKEHREEYNYRFPDAKPRLLSLVVFVLCILGLQINLILWGVFIPYSSNEYYETIIAACNFFSRLLMIIAALSLFGPEIKEALQTYKENKWLKERGYK